MSMLSVLLLCILLYVDRRDNCEVKRTKEGNYVVLDHCTFDPNDVNTLDDSTVIIPVGTGGTCAGIVEGGTDVLTQNVDDLNMSDVSDDDERQRPRGMSNNLNNNNSDDDEASPSSVSSMPSAPPRDKAPRPVPKSSDRESVVVRDSVITATPYRDSMMTTESSHRDSTSPTASSFRVSVVLATGETAAGDDDTQDAASNFRKLESRDRHLSDGALARRRPLPAIPGPSTPAPTALGPSSLGPKVSAPVPVVKPAPKPTTPLPRFTAIKE